MSRALRDVACMRLDLIGDERGTALWLLTRVTPDPKKCYDVPPPVEPWFKSMPAEALLNRATARHFEGGDVACVSLGRKPRELTFPYRWQFTQIYGGPDPGPAYAPFREGPALIVFRFHSYAKNEADCSPIYLLPRDWEAWVLPAVDARRRQKRLNADTRPDGNQSGDATPSETNPLLVIDEFRRRADDSSDQPEFAEVPLERSRGFLQAVLAYLLVTSADQRPAAIEAIVSRVIAGSGSPESISGLTLGVVTAEDDNTSEDELAASTAIIREIKARCDRFRAGGEDVQDLDRMLSSRDIGRAGLTNDAKK
jgi:hypothetical protein